MWRGKRVDANTRTKNAPAARRGRLLFGCLCACQRALLFCARIAILFFATALANCQKCMRRGSNSHTGLFAWKLLIVIRLQLQLCTAVFVAAEREGSVCWFSQILCAASDCDLLCVRVGVKLYTLQQTLVSALLILLFTGWQLYIYILLRVVQCQNQINCIEKMDSDNRSGIWSL